VVAGTATAVSNRVSRRQAGRWAAQDQQQYAEPQAPPPPAPAPPAAAAAEPDMDDTIAQLKELASLRDQGVLTEAEFTAQKSRLLA
jgi:hypothetical protein